MNENEMLKSIQDTIELFAKKNMDKELLIVHDMIKWKKNDDTEPLMRSLKDVFYFINGILFMKGLSDHWGGSIKKKVFTGGNL